MGAGGGHRGGRAGGVLAARPATRRDSAPQIPAAAAAQPAVPHLLVAARRPAAISLRNRSSTARARCFVVGRRCRIVARSTRGKLDDRCADYWCRACRFDGRRVPAAAGLRSEEHTSELQSLMRISYAVFCLKKKKKQKKIVIRVTKRQA